MAYNNRLISVNYVLWLIYGLLWSIVAYYYGLLSVNYGLLWSIVACCFRLLSVNYGLLWSIVACCFRLLSVNCGLLWSILACYFGLLGVPGGVYCRAPFAYEWGLKWVPGKPSSLKQWATIPQSSS